MLEARRSDDKQASVVSSGSSTFHAHTEARAGLGRQMTLSSLEEKIMPSPARHHAAGQVHQRTERGEDRRGVPIHPPCEPENKPVPAPTYFAAQRPLQFRYLKPATENVDGKEVYPGLGSGFGP